MLKVGGHEHVFRFNISIGNKTAESAQKVRVGRVSGNTAIFFLLFTP